MIKWLSLDVTKISRRLIFPNRSVLYSHVLFTRSKEGSRISTVGFTYKRSHDRGPHEDVFDKVPGNLGFPVTKISVK